MTIEQFPRPVFIIGAPRSGTSVLTWCLGQHSNIITLPETNWIAALGSHVDAFWQIGTNGGSHLHLAAFGVSQAQFAEAFGRMIHDLIKTSFEAQMAPQREAMRMHGTTGKVAGSLIGEHADAKNRWVDGTPANSQYAAVLYRMFPHARFIHLVREPDAVVTSLLASNQFSSHWTNAMAAIQYAYDATRAGYLAERAFGPTHVIRVYHHELTNSPQQQMTRVLKFAGEEFEPDCIAPLGTIINNSDAERKASVARSLNKYDGPHLSKLREWFAKAEVEDWSIELTPQQAREELEDYSRIPISMPSASKVKNFW